MHATTTLRIGLLTKHKSDVIRLQSKRQLHQDSRTISPLLLVEQHDVKT